MQLCAVGKQLMPHAAGAHMLVPHAVMPLQHAFAIATLGLVSTCQTHHGLGRLHGAMNHQAGQCS